MASRLYDNFGSVALLVNFVLLDEFVFDVFQTFARADLLESAPGGSHIGGLSSRGACIFHEKGKIKSMIFLATALPPSWQNISINGQHAL